MTKVGDQTRARGRQTVSRQRRWPRMLATGLACLMLACPTAPRAEEPQGPMRGLATGRDLLEAMNEVFDEVQRAEAAGDPVRADRLLEEMRLQLVRAREMTSVESVKSKLSWLSGLLLTARANMTPVPADPARRPRLLAQAFDEKASQATPDDLCLLLNAGDSWASSGSVDKALDSWRQALAFARPRATRETQDVAWVRQAISALEKIGQTLYDQGKTEAGLDALQEARELARQAVDTLPGDVDRADDLQAISRRLARLRQQAGQLDQAQALRQEVQALAQRQVDSRPDDPVALIALADAHFAVAEVHKVQQHPEEAMASYQASMALWRRLAAAPSTAGRDAPYQVQLSLNRMGDLHRRADRFEQGLASHLEALAIARDLAAATPQDARRQWDLSICLERVAMAQEALSRWQPALTNYLAAAELRQRLMEQDPAEREWRSDLAFTALRIGTLPEEALPLAERRRWLDRGLGLMEALRQEGRWIKSDERRRDNLLEALAEIH